MFLKEDNLKKEGFKLNVVGLNPYNKVISTYCLYDKRLSFKAKGLLITLLSCSDKFHTSIYGLSKLCLDKRDSVISGVNELVKNDYLHITHIRNSKGQFDFTEWSVCPFPFNVLEDALFDSSKVFYTDMSNPGQVALMMAHEQDNKSDSEVWFDNYWKDIKTEYEKNELLKNDINKNDKN